MQFTSVQEVKKKRSVASIHHQSVYTIFASWSSFELPRNTFIFHTPVTLFTTPRANHRIVGEFMLTLRPMISNKKTIYDHVVEGHD